MRIERQIALLEKEMNKSIKRQNLNWTANLVNYNIDTTELPYYTTITMEVYARDDKIYTIETSILKGDKTAFIIGKIWGIIEEREMQ